MTDSITREIGEGYVIYRTPAGNWVNASGEAFPPGTIGIPTGSRYVRTDLLKAYLWDGEQWIEEPGAGGGPGGGGITISEADGLPLQAGVTDLQIDSADGLSLTIISPTEARIDLSDIPQALVTDLVADLAGKEATGVAAGLVATHEADPDPHPQYSLDSDLTAHVAAADPHTVYQKESEKGAASGYASLDAGTLVPVAQLPAGTTAAKGVLELATDGEVAASLAVQANDSRLSNARTPTAHATSHQNGGSDEISVTGLSGLLADDQTPSTHNILTKHNGFPGGGTTFLRDDGTFAAPPGGGGGDSITINGVALVDADFDDATPAPPAGEINVKWQKDAGSPANVSASVQAATTAVKGVVELATDGESAASVVVQGNDARMSNARTPTAHAASHQEGSDPYRPTFLPFGGITSSFPALKRNAALAEVRLGDDSAYAGIIQLVSVSTAYFQAFGGGTLPAAGQFRFDSGVTPSIYCRNVANGADIEMLARDGSDNTTTKGQIIETRNNKGAASGYASLDGTTKVPTAELGSGAAGAGVFLRGDQTWAAAGGSGADPPEGSYAPGAYTIATGKFRVAVFEQEFTGTQELAIEGTGALSIMN
jgi:hypothetical protein